MTCSRRDRRHAAALVAKLNARLFRRRVRSGMERALDSVLALTCLLATFEVLVILALPGLLERYT